MDVFVKRRAGAPAGFFACEAAGLQWLSAADGGVPCARVVDHDARSLTLERLTSVPPSRAAGREFGARLAATHDAGAQSFGAGPATGADRFFGPLSDPLLMSLTGHRSWGSFYAEERLRPMAEAAGARLSTDGRADRPRHPALSGGRFRRRRSPGPAARRPVERERHVDACGCGADRPAAHGGHRETDLAMLALFGCPYLDAVLDGYREVHPLRRGWRADRAASALPVARSRGVVRRQLHPSDGDCGSWRGGTGRLTP